MRKTITTNHLYNKTSVKLRELAIIAIKLVNFLINKYY